MSFIGASFLFTGVTSLQIYRKKRAQTKDVVDSAAKGAVAGAVIGGAVGGPVGAGIGAAVGAVVGALACLISCKGEPDIFACMSTVGYLDGGLISFYFMHMHTTWSIAIVLYLCQSKCSYTE